MQRQLSIVEKCCPDRAAQPLHVEASCRTRGAPLQGSKMSALARRRPSKVARTAPVASQPQLHEAGAASHVAEASGHDRGVNLRDLSSVDGRIQPGRVHRSSQARHAPQWPSGAPTALAMAGMQAVNAHQPQRCRPLQVVSAAELEKLRIAAVLDLRQPSVRCKTHAASWAGFLRRQLAECLRWVAPSIWGGRRAAPWRRRGDGAGAGGTQPCHLCTSECCHHYGIPARVYHGGLSAAKPRSSGAAGVTASKGGAIVPSPQRLLKSPVTAAAVDLLPTRVSLRILWELPRGIQARVLWAAVRRRHAEPIVAGAQLQLHAQPARGPRRHTSLAVSERPSPRS